MLLGVVDLGYPEDYARFQKWLAEGRHGEMRYLEQYPEVRRDPRQLLEGARSVVVVALPYALGDQWTEGPHAPRVAQYARLPDYHKALKDRAERVARAVTPDGAFRVVVDTAPVLERALAARTTDGFIGKNTLFIHPTRGSFFLLGEILLTESLEADPKAPIPLDRKTKEGGCGPCRLCQDHCPTGALDEAYRIDARKCLAYWTIEHRGAIPEAYWPHLAKYYFGCDICQLVCPYNRKGQPIPAPSWLAERKLPGLFETAVMTQQEYVSYFGGTPMTRAKRGGLRRNALIALAVTGDPRLRDAMDQAVKDSEPPLPETLIQLTRFLQRREGESSTST